MRPEERLITLDGLALQRAHLQDALSPAASAAAGDDDDDDPAWVVMGSA